MNNPLAPLASFVHRLPALLALVSSLTIIAFGQVESSQYDRGTPPQHAAGVSALGSYISTDLGTINLSNGSLNLAIPLSQVGGRGFSLPLTLNYSSKVWSASMGVDIVSDPTVKTYPAAIASYDSLEGGPDLYQRVAPGWTIGGVPMLRVRGVGVSQRSNPPCGATTDYLKVLTKLTLMLPDKGEVELRDDLTDGSPLGGLPLSPGNCLFMDGNRGQRWHAADGSGIGFISDVTNGVVNGNLNGWLITADGTRYRFTDNSSYYPGSVFLNELSRAESVTDRNGNRVQINYSTSPLAVSFIDQLGRATTVEYGVTDPVAGALAVRVTVPGYNGQSRQYKVKTGLMNANYRSGINPTLPVYNGWADAMGEFCGSQSPSGTNLFESWCGGREQIDNRSVLTELILPDTRSLKFRYNEYGEVAEVEMPTGGKVQYDYAYENGMPSGNSALFEVNPLPTGPGNVAAIDRAVVARRTYPDGVNVESHWSYAYSATPGANGAASNGVTEIIARASDNSTVLSRQKHYFLNASRFQSSSGGSAYSLWSTGLERRSEVLDAAGTATISASEQDWSQRTPVVWSYGYASEQTQNDNRVNEARNILETGQTARSTMTYDLFNNPIETNQFDFDNTLKRRTVTSYSSTNLVNGVNYAADSIRLLRLPLQQSVYDGAGVEQARSISEYDIYTGDGNHALMQVYGSASGHDTANYGALKTARGNATRLGSWIKSSNTYLYSYPRYDMLGNVVSAKDARGNVSTISFADDFGDGSNPGSHTNNPATPTYALPTLITSPPPTAGAPVHTASSQYDLSTGLQTGFRDRNNIITQTLYTDPFNRPTQVKSAFGTGLETWAAMYYAPATKFGNYID